MLAGLTGAGLGFSEKDSSLPRIRLRSAAGWTHADSTPTTHRQQTRQHTGSRNDKGAEAAVQIAVDVISIALPKGGEVEEHDVYACICAAVTEGQVRACIEAGAGTAEEIGERCGAGTGCGSCLDRLDVLLDPPAALDPPAGVDRPMLSEGLAVSDRPVVRHQPLVLDQPAALDESSPDRRHAA
ncbi:MAG TPA: (2Fe-2S)-binding protein [Amycolatopsis sp.]|nr:(2Fe-2S)-binding protein [Amycolatopsis sp.]